MKVLLIIPAYNEAKNLTKVVNKINSYNEKSKDFKLDYIIINDGSKDDTEKICKEKNYNCVNLISNLGIGGAVQTGYKYALKNDYDIAIQFDGDGQHDVNYVKTICEDIINNMSDFCIGSRFIDETSNFKSTFARRVGIRIISSFIKLFTRKTITDPTSGFRAANKKVIEMFAESYPTDYPEPESSVTLIKNNIRITEKPVKMHEREEGKSSINMRKSAYYMIRVCLAIVIESCKFSKKVGDKK